ncbi:signal peptidase I [Actinacidiphila yanglinensis]|uniref:Signal peptidase I n=1 Tax=Actinacidiphila yanglinensis TaxID=310779 RepID=A0A1H6E1K5_9ACTN|nr:signal peptidase I [Actinacidiphila yanglinensis]SEG90815.1 signal peptidase I [Actinacidiphila yanglinensis]
MSSEAVGTDGPAEDAPESGGVPAADPPGRRRAAGPRPMWKEIPLLVVVALVLALLIKTFFVQAFSIPSDSMQNTLQRGDRVLVDKFTPWFGSTPERGDVVVFHDPDDWLADEPTAHPNPLQKALAFVGLMPSANERDLIKRVIAVGGDTVECHGSGPVEVNGKPLAEPYVYAGNTPCSTDNQGQFTVTVPHGDLWVMGDHRQDSADSRYHQDDAHQGFVPVGNVVGRAFVVGWPLSHWAVLHVPGTFGQPGIGAASAAAPGALGMAGAAPLVLWRRRRRPAGRPRENGGTGERA